MRNREPSRLRTSFGAGTPVQAIGLPRRPMGDLYHLLLTWTWTRLFAAMAVAYLVTNALFALAYLALGPGAIVGARPGSFEDAFFFAFQTMATIGYGQLLPHGTMANLLSVAQAMIGIAGTAVATGLVFGKFARPTSRVLFSHHAVITTFDGAPALLFRMANERANQIVEAQLSVSLIRDERTKEGQPIRRAYDLPLKRDRSLVFSLTWTAVHPITPGSPLHGETPESLSRTAANVVASLSGVDEHFGQTIHARAAWRAEEILFGVRFVDILSEGEGGSRVIDYRRFHDVVPDGEGVPRAGEAGTARHP